MEGVARKIRLNTWTEKRPKEFVFYPELHGESLLSFKKGE